MKLGFQSMNTPADLRPDRLGRALEERGFDSLWIGEHSHIPVSRKTPYPSGGELPPKYLEMMDPFVSLTLAASATTRLRVGTGVTLPLEHHILGLAKAVATLDQLSEGRVSVGVGVGWNVEELANHSSVPWAQRYRALAEYIAALRALWSDEEAEFHGQYVDFDPVWSNPKPLQKPYPPVLCGTGGKLGTTHAVAWADGWMPLDIALGSVAKKIGLFRAATEEAHRDEIPISLAVFGDPTLERLMHYRELGVERVILGLESSGWLDATTTLPFLDRYAAMLPELQG